MSLTKAGLVLRVRVTPKAAANRLGGAGEDAEGRRFLKLQVTAVPDKGKANEAVIKLLAKSLKWPKSAFEIVSGASERNKAIAIAGDGASLKLALKRALGEDIEIE